MGNSFRQLAESYSFGIEYRSPTRTTILFTKAQTVVLTVTMPMAGPGGSFNGANKIDFERVAISRAGIHLSYQ
jgi:hypothetical protein